MVALHAFLALLAGFATMAVLVIAITGLLVKLVPGWVSLAGKPQLSYVLFNLAYSSAAAVAGGYVTAMVSAGNSLIQVLVLAIVILVMGALSALQSRGKQPVWYALSLVALMPVSVLAGGFLRLRFTGIL